jgi:hypothetical protein
MSLNHHNRNCLGDYYKAAGVLLIRTVTRSHNDSDNDLLYEIKGINTYQLLLCVEERVQPTMDRINLEKLTTNRLQLTYIGGKKDTDDEDLYKTAHREFVEETLLDNLSCDTLIRNIKTSQTIEIFDSKYIMHVLDVNKYSTDNTNDIHCLHNIHMEFADVPIDVKARGLDATSLFLIWVGVDKFLELLKIENSEPQVLVQTAKDTSSRKINIGFSKFIWSTLKSKPLMDYLNRLSKIVIAEDKILSYPLSYNDEEIPTIMASKAIKIPIYNLFKNKSHTTSRRTKTEGGCIPNVENIHCYMNSLIQLFTRVTPLILENDNEQFKFRDLYNNIKSLGNKIVKNKKFVTQLEHKTFRKVFFDTYTQFDDEQLDVHEVWINILDTVGAKPNIHFKSFTKFKDLDNNHVESVVDVSHLCLPVAMHAVSKRKRATMEQSLFCYFDTDYKDNYELAIDKKATSHDLLTKPYPQIIPIQVIRTEFHPKRLKMYKRTDHLDNCFSITFPNKYLHDDNDTALYYHLVAFIYHDGEISTSGHYYIYIKEDNTDNTWICYDDHIKDVVDEETLLLKASTAYMYIYKKQTETEHRHNDPVVEGKSIELKQNEFKVEEIMKNETNNNHNNINNAVDFNPLRIQTKTNRNSPMYEILNELINTFQKENKGSKELFTFPWCVNHDNNFNASSKKGGTTDNSPIVVDRINHDFVSSTMCNKAIITLPDHQLLAIPNYFNDSLINFWIR